MRKQITFLLTSILFLVYFSQGQVVFEDSFESGTFNNWAVDGGTAVIDVAPYEGSYCFQGTHGNQMQKKHLHR